MEWFRYLGLGKKKKKGAYQSDIRSSTGSAIKRFKPQVSGTKVVGLAKIEREAAIAHGGLTDVTIRARLRYCQGSGVAGAR